MKDENKNQEKTEGQQEQTKQPSFLKRAWDRYKRDLRDVAIGVAVGGIVTYEVLTVRSKKAAEETVPEEDQETEEEEEEDVLEVSDE